MNLKKVVSILISVFCLITFLFVSCSKSEKQSEKQSDSQELSSAEEQVIDEKNEDLALDLEKENLKLELLEMSLEEIVENNDFDFVLEDAIEICKKNTRWYCTFCGSMRAPVYLAHDIKDDVLNVYYSNEGSNIDYPKIDGRFYFGGLAYKNLYYVRTCKFSITRDQLIEYMTTEAYKLPAVEDCDTYADSIQYINPLNIINAAVIDENADLFDKPGYDGDNISITKLSQWDIVQLIGRITLPSSLDENKNDVFYLVNVNNNVNNTKENSVSGWIQASSIKMFRTKPYGALSDIQGLKYAFTKVTPPALDSGVQCSGTKVPVQGDRLYYCGYDENYPIIDSIESFLNNYTDSELENVKEFDLSYEVHEPSILNPAISEQGYGEIPSLKGLERIPKLETVNIGDSVHVKSLKGIENIKNLKELRLCYDCLSDEDKIFLEPFKTKYENVFYFNGYGSEVESKTEVSEDMKSFFDEYGNSVWISSFDGPRTNRELPFEIVELPDNCHYLIFETLGKDIYFYYGFGDGGHVFDHIAGSVVDAKKINDDEFEVSVNLATNLSDFLYNSFVDNIYDVDFSDETEVITVSRKNLENKNGFILNFNNSKIANKNFQKYSRSKMDKIYYNSFVTKDNVSVKTGISEDDKILTVINNGEKIHIISKDKNSSVDDNVEDYWYQVELRNGLKGWIFGSAISKDAVSD